jgi:energy-coupling factor transporter ATP-binding protein EcfA2
MILGIAGKKQSGKSTIANILHGIVLSETEAIQDWNISNGGKLNILTDDKWGEFDISRKDDDFVSYAEHHMWPFIKLYSFADTVKWMCTDLFDVPNECVWGTDEQKNQLQEHLRWENMPRFQNMNLMVKMPIDARKSWGWREGPMTSREFMQFIGTDIMRKIYAPVWTNNTIRRITSEQSALAVVADVRFPNEAKAIEEASGLVVRMKRQVFDDNHSSEVALDDYSFSDYIDNQNGNIQDLVRKGKQLYNLLKEKNASNIR